MSIPMKSDRGEALLLEASNEALLFLAALSNAAMRRQIERELGRRSAAGRGRRPGQRGTVPQACAAA
jgi:hypothetical protein